MTSDGVGMSREYSVDTRSQACRFFELALVRELDDNPSSGGLGGTAGAGL